MLNIALHRLLPVLLIAAVSATENANGSCPPYPYQELEHGQVQNVSENKYSFRCDKGYFLASPSLVRCRKGKWTSDKQPLCLRSEGQCDDPPQISGGNVLGDARKVGSVVQYMCHAGYVMLDESTRVCLKSGYWSGVTPTCMDEHEPLQTLAERLKEKFLTNISAYSSDSIVPQARKLDSISLMRGLELVILLDRSSSIDPVDFKIGVDFIKFLLHQFGVRNGENENGTRAAVVTFGTKEDIVFNVDNATISSPLAANATLDTLQAGGGGTAMELALVTVISKIEPLLRKRAKKAIFLMTDGEPNIGSPGITPVDFARQLKSSGGFEIFTVGIGRGINRKLLAEMASEPLLSHVFILDKYSDLENITRIIRDRPSGAPAISPERCGYISDPNRYLKEWPWLAALYVGLPHEPEAPRLSLCGGTLICSQWVLTAASCFHHVSKKNNSVEVQVNLKEVFVVLGEKNLTSDDETQMNFYAMDVQIHPEFEAQNDLLNNLALVKLNEPAPVERFRPVCLPPTGRIVPLHLNLTINASIAGWGLKPNILDTRDINGGTVEIMMADSRVGLSEKGECQGMLQAQEHIFCAGHGSNTFIGDIGSPIIGMDESTHLHHLLGVLTKRSKRTQFLNRYTELIHYLQWINDVTRGCHSKHWMV